VFEQEPTDPADPLFVLDNVIVTPHALCWTDQCFAGNGAADIRAVLDIQHGRIPRGIVNRAVFEKPSFRRKLEEYRRQFAN
jgi:D-3-phosphoglycerate dehydrogenase